MSSLPDRGPESGRERIRPAREADLERILALLRVVNLPTAGVPEHLPAFFILERDRTIVGSVGLELYGDSALLRSLAVAPERQGRGDGGRLCRAALERGRELGVERIVLLTETASAFFEKFGFRRIAREEVPDAVKLSLEFTSCCPVSAVCMLMRLPAPDSDKQTTPRKQAPREQRGPTSKAPEERRRS